MEKVIVLNISIIKITYFMDKLFIEAGPEMFRGDGLGNFFSQKGEPTSNIALISSNSE